MNFSLNFCKISEGLDKKILSCFAEKSIPHNCLIVRNGYFIGLKFLLDEQEYKKVIAHSGIEIFFDSQTIYNAAQNCEGLSQLVVGRIDSLKEITSCLSQLNSYVSIFLKVLFQVYSEFISNLMIHFTARQIENRPFIQNAHIRLEISECLAILETIKMTSENFSLIESVNLSINLDRLILLGRKCIKLLGGVSQLKGSVLEPYLVTMLVINIYCDK